MPRYLASAVDLLWAATAATLIAAAALVTLARLLLPEVSSQRELVASWIAETVGRPAQVGEITASWRGWAPTIRVSGIHFFDPTSSAELVQFRRATINIAPLGSLLSWSLKPKSLILSGVELTLLRDAQGRFSVAGMPPPKSPIIKWLLVQDNFAVTDADLTIVDARSAQRFALSDLSVTIRNRDGVKWITGLVDLPGSIGEHLVVEYSARGDPLGDDWRGAINFRLDGLRSDYLVEQLAWGGPRPPASVVNMLGWSQWDAAQLSELRFKLDAAAPGSAANPLLVTSGRMSRRSAGWRLEIADLVLPMLARAAAPARFTLAWDSSDGTAQAFAGRGENLPIEPLAVILAGLGPRDGAWREALAPLGPSGLLKSFAGAWQRTADGSTDRYFADLELRRLSSNQHAAVPGLTGLDARLLLRRNGAEITFDDAAVRLDHDTVLHETLDVTTLNGTLRWQHDGGTEVLRASGLRADVNGSRLHVDGSLSDPFGDAAALDLAIGIPHADARRLHHLIPHGRLPQRGERWAREVLVDGHVRNGAILVRGSLAQFPFRQADGVFHATFDVDQATVRYSPRWPLASALSGRLELRGPQVRMEVEAADVLDARINTAEITMADLFTTQRYVHIRGNAHGPAHTATDIVMASPLRQGKAARLADLDIGGDIEVDLDIEVGLFPNGPREVLGQARFDGNRVQAVRERIALEEFTGAVSFTRGDWYGEGLSAVFEGIPVGLVLNGGLDDPNYDSEFRMTGTASAATVITQLKKRLPAVHAWLDEREALGSLSGTLPWKAVLTIPSADASAAALPRRLVLESSLRGFGIALPAPLDKAADVIRPLRLQLALADGLARHTRIDFGDTLDAEIDLRRDADGHGVIERAAILFGALEPEFERRPGISARGYLAELPYSAWSSLVQKAPRKPVRAGSAALPLNFDLQVSALQALGTRFEDVRVQGQRGAEHWNINIDGDAVSGHIEAPREVARGSLVAKLARLHLGPPAEHGGALSTALDPRRLPAVDFLAESLRFGAIELGRAEIRTSRGADGLRLEQLSFRDQDFELDAAGQWDMYGDAHTSRFHIDLSSATLAGVLDRFGYNVANISGGKTDMSIDASWPGTPVEFTLARLAGNFELHVSDGRLLDVDPGGGRLFGLLSLQSLPRRLLLDFDDLFRKGFAFDSIDGVFQLEDGNAYTNSLLMSGPSARIDISGRTGLAEQDYDQRIVVTPALSNSIPVAGALFGPIGVGAGAVYYLGQKMFKSIPESIDRFLSRHYSVTGSWEQPSIERL